MIAPPNAVEASTASRTSGDSAPSPAATVPPPPHTRLQPPQRIVLTIEDVDAPPFGVDNLFLQAWAATSDAHGGQGVYDLGQPTTPTTTNALSTRMTHRNIRYSWHLVAQSGAMLADQPTTTADGAQQNTSTTPLHQGPQQPSTRSSSANAHRERDGDATTAPAARFGHTAIVYGDEMILFGGREHSQFYNDMWSFHLVRHCWRQHLPQGGVEGSSTDPTAPAPRAGHTATLVDGRTMFVVGGCTGVLHTACVGDVWAVDLVTKAWRRVEPAYPSNPHHRWSPTTTTTTAGGASGATTNAAPSYAYYTSDNQPHPVHVPAIAAPPMPTRRTQTLPPRKGHTAVNVDDTCLLVFGGSCGVAGADDNWTWRLDCATGGWTILPTTGGAPSPRMYHVAELTERSTMLVFGGKARGNEFCQDLWELSLAKDAQGQLVHGVWRGVEVAGPVIPSARFCCSSIYHNGVLCVFLGGSQCYHEDSYEFELATRQWRRLPESSTFNLQPCTRPTTVRHNNTITMFGGCKPDNVCTNTVVEMELETPTLKEFCREWVRQHTAVAPALLSSPLTPHVLSFATYRDAGKLQRQAQGYLVGSGDATTSPLSPQHTTGGGGSGLVGHRSFGNDVFEDIHRRMHALQNMATEGQANAGTGSMPRVHPTNGTTNGTIHGNAYEAMESTIQQQLPESLQQYLAANHDDGGYN